MSIHFLIVLVCRISQKIKAISLWWSLYPFSRPVLLIINWQCEEKFDASHSWGFIVKTAKNARDHPAIISIRKIHMAWILLALGSFHMPSRCFGQYILRLSSSGLWEHPAFAALVSPPERSYTWKYLCSRRLLAHLGPQHFPSTPPSLFFIALTVWSMPVSRAVGAYSWVARIFQPWGQFSI